MSDGKRLERDLKRVHKRYKSKGQAFVYKIPTPLEIERELGGAKVLARKERGHSGDFGGHLPDGRVVHIEAKEFTAEGISFPLTRVKPHQMERVLNADLCGGVGGLYIRHVHDGIAEDYFIRGRDIDRLRAGRKSIRFSAMDGHRVPFDGWVETVQSPTCQARKEWIERRLHMNITPGEEKVLTSELKGIEDAAKFR